MRAETEAVPKNTLPGIPAAGLAPLKRGVPVSYRSVNIAVLHSAGEAQQWRDHHSRGCKLDRRRHGPLHPARLMVSDSPRTATDMPTAAADMQHPEAGSVHSVTNGCRSAQPSQEHICRSDPWAMLKPGDKGYTYHFMRNRMIPPNGYRSRLDRCAYCSLASLAEVGCSFFLNGCCLPSGVHLVARKWQATSHLLCPECLAAS